MKRLEGFYLMRFCQSFLVTIGALMSIILAEMMIKSEALASEMPRTLSMSCNQTVKLVAKSGAIVLRTGENTYDRYVRDLQFCDLGDSLRPEWVPTRDNPQCFIGYTCYLPHIDNWPN